MPAGLSKLFSSCKTIKIPTEAAALLILLVGFESAASNGSWVQQPSWSASDSPAGPAARKSTLTRETPRHQTSPFAPGSNNFALDVGQVFLMGDLGNKYSDNIGAQLHYTYGVSDLFGFDASMGYSDHSEGKFSKLTLLTGLRTNLAWYDKVIPYLVFGLGFYKPSYTILGEGNESSTTLSPVLFGVHLGPGIDLELTKQFFFGAAMTFHDVFGGTRKLANNKEIDVGGTFTSFFLHVGMTF